MVGRQSERLEEGSETFVADGVFFWPTMRKKGPREARRRASVTD